MSALCFDAARGRWYSPDLSAGNVAMLTEDGGEWPISGDKITKQRRNQEPPGLLGVVDWVALGADDCEDQDEQHTP